MKNRHFGVTVKVECEWSAMKPVFINNNFKRGAYWNNAACEQGLMGVLGPVTPRKLAHELTKRTLWSSSTLFFTTK